MITLYASSGVVSGANSSSVDVTFPRDGSVRGVQLNLCHMSTTATGLTSGQCQALSSTGMLLAILESGFSQSTAVGSSQFGMAIFVPLYMQMMKFQKLRLYTASNGADCQTQAYMIVHYEERV